MSTTPRPVIGYLPKGYPRISETFISNEILELERLGFDIRIFSLKRPEGRGRQPSARAVRAPVRYLPEKIVLSLPKLLPVHFWVALRYPRGYFKALRWTLTRCLRYRRTSTLRRFFQAGWLVGWELRGMDIRHFHAHFCHGPATVAMFVKWMIGSTYSFTGHAKDVYLTKRDVLRQKIHEAEFMLTCTRANRDYVSELAGGKGRIHLVYHGIDTERFDRDREERIVPLRAYADGQRVPTVLSVGRLVEKKGFDTLLRACALLRDRGIRFQCVIYGDGEKRAALESLVQSLDLQSHVTMPGGILQDDLIEIYRQADVFALACQVLANGDRDGLPNVLVEAQAMRLPVVATDVSGIPELIDDGVNGYLVPSRAPEALADRIGALLEDAGLRRSMGEAGRRRVEAAFSVQHNTQRIRDLFYEALGLPLASTAAAARATHGDLDGRDPDLGPDLARTNPRP